MRAFLPILLAGLMAPALSAQTGTLDQSSPFGNAWFNGGTNVLVWQAEVATGIGGTLEGFEIEIQAANVGSTVDLAIKVGAGWNTGTAAWTGTATNTLVNTWERVFLDTSAAGIVLNPGDLFVIEMTGNTGMGLHGEYVAPPGTPPYPEELYLNGPGCFADCGWRIGFNTYMLTGPRLSKAGTCPGPITLTVTDATPNGNVAMIYGNAGTFTQNGNPCNGLTIPVSNPTLAGIIQANGSGVATVSFNAPPGICGKTVIGVDIQTCGPTNTITL